MTDHLPESPKVVLSAEERRSLRAVRWESASGLDETGERILAAHLTAQAAEHERAIDRLCDGLQMWREDARVFERALADLRAGIESLAAKWDEERKHFPTKTNEVAAYAETAVRMCGEELRALLATENRHDESEEG
jgi:predicted  nucleic acid-binding Zn-ribbon protein